MRTRTRTRTRMQPWRYEGADDSFSTRREAGINFANGGERAIKGNENPGSCRARYASRGGWTHSRLSAPCVQQRMPTQHVALQNINPLLAPAGFFPSSVFLACMPVARPGGFGGFGVSGGIRSYPSVVLGWLAMRVCVRACVRDCFYGWAGGSCLMRVGE